MQEVLGIHRKIAEWWSRVKKYGIVRGAFVTRINQLICTNDECLDFPEFVSDPCL